MISKTNVQQRRDPRNCSRVPQVALRVEQDSILNAAMREALSNYLRQKGASSIGAMLRNIDLQDPGLLAPVAFGALDELARTGDISIAATSHGGVAVSWIGRAEVAEITRQALEVRR